jgi:hypothetical protein
VTLCNYKKHLLTQKHKTNIELKKAKDDKKDEEKDEKDEKKDDKDEFYKNKDNNKLKKNTDLQINCKFCDKTLRKSNKARHYMICNKSKKHITDDILESEYHDPREKIQELFTKLQTKEKEFEMIKTKYELSIEQNEKYIDLIKHQSSQSSNKITYNINYIMNNCKDAFNYNEIMNEPLTIEEINDLNDSSALVGSTNLLSERCIDNIDFHKRPLHLLDKSRNKYCVKLNDSWKIDSKGNEITKRLFNKVKDVYLVKNDDDTVEVIMKKNNKFKSMYDEKGKILEYINDQIMLKNNVNLIDE